MKPSLSVITRNALTLFFLLNLAGFCHAQGIRKPDIIVLKNNTKLEVSIQEVEQGIIKYKKISDPDGPVFSVEKAEISSVLYGNGDVSTFPETSGDVFFKQDSNPEPVSRNQQPIPKNAFDETIFAYKPNQLRNAYQYYRSKSKRGLVSGIICTVLGTISMGVGAALLNDNYYYSNGYYASTYNNNQGTGVALLIGGLIGGATFGTIGFVKAGRNGSKATRIRRELLRRGEGISFKFQPGFNPVTQSGNLSLRLNF